MFGLREHPVRIVDLDEALRSVVLVVEVPIGMPFERHLLVRELDLALGRIGGDAQHGERIARRGRIRRYRHVGCCGLE